MFNKYKKNNLTVFVSRVASRLKNAPQRKSLVLRIVLLTPKKPNSALRHAAKSVIYKNSKKVYARVPGIGMVPMKYNRLLLRGGRANDIPSIRLTAIRNVYDFAGLYGKKKRRSIYGTPRPEYFTGHIRRRYRKMYA